MKKIFSVRSFCCIVAASTLFACTQEVIEPFPVQTENEKEVMNELPKLRTYEEALAVAQKAIGMLGENSVTRSGKPRTVCTADVQYITRTSPTRSDGELDTLMYVFNYEDNAGFAVVSANRATEELIAVTEQGNYVTGEETGNGGFDLYMDMAEEYVQSRRPPLLDSLNNGREELTQTKIVTDVDTTTYGPFLQVRWGQHWPYNKYCYTTDGQKAPSGCVATAIVQLMSYYKHPSSIVVDYDGNTQTLHLDWDAMNNHVYSFIPVDYPSSCPCTYPYAEVHNKIGHVFRQIGKYVKMIYYTSGSEANSANVATALANLGYAYGSYRDYNSSEVTSSIRNSQVVYMRGVDTNANVGHAWVIDGYKSIYGTGTIYIKPDSQLFWEILEQHTISEAYYHINWGWNGDSNGYFCIGAFDTTNMQFSHPDDPNTMKHNFTRNLKIYPNIRKQL
ncbi:MAG: C10 family peptidase [Bacteroidaceae bacterium]|nr:C10 family peptidase [Bacteroidaceae bacterium]